MTVAIVAILGLAFGSFVNALVWRLKTKRDWVNERSICPQCKHVLGPQDLVPVLSWLVLRGKCRYCQKSISVQYPLVELLTAGLFIISLVCWPATLTGSFGGLWPFGVWLVALVAMVAMAVYDIHYMEIPDKIVYPLIALSVVYVAVEAVLVQKDPLVIRDAVVGLLVSGGLFYSIYQLSNGKWLGGGDVKLGFALGLLLGARDAFIMLYTASLGGAVVMAVLMAAKVIGRKSKIPFGPFLIGGAIIAKLCGASIWAWYKGLM